MEIMKKIKSIIFSLLYLSSLSTALAVDYTGVAVHPYTNNIPASQIVSLLNSYGINSIRTDYYWDWSEKEKGKYEVPNRKTEDLILEAANNNITTVIILNHGNKLYGDGLPRNETQIEAFSNYAVWVASKFKGKQYIFEIWNEWSRNKENKYNIFSAEEYVELVKAVSKKIKAVNPEANIIAGSFNIIGNDRTWGEKIVRLGVLNYVNGLSIHPYSFMSNKDREPKNNIDSIYREQLVLKKIANRTEDIPLYITEVGYPSTCKYPHLSEDTVGKYLYKYYSYANNFPNIKGIWWYDLINDGNDCQNNEHNFGLFRSDLESKPSAKYLKSLKNK